jgi:hypothetical protein
MAIELRLRRYHLISYSLHNKILQNSFDLYHILNEDLLLVLISVRPGGGEADPIYPGIRQSAFLPPPLVQTSNNSKV